MRKNRWALSLAIVLLVCVGIMAFASGKIAFTDGKVTISEETPSLCEEFDIASPELEAYLGTIEDPVKKELLEKYLYLPSELIPERDRKATTDPLSLAIEMSKLPNEELEAIVSEMEESIPKLKDIKEDEYDMATKGQLDR